MTGQKKERQEKESRHSPRVSGAPSLTLDPHRAPTHRQTADTDRERLTDERLSLSMLL